VSPGSELPPLVLRCRPLWRLALGGSAAAQIVLATALLAGRLRDPLAGSGLEDALGPVLLVLGLASAWFVARHCFTRLLLDERGFRLRGPLGSEDVAWGSVVRWERLRGAGGLGVLRVVHGEGRRRLTIPLIYEDCHLLELGLRQGGFPRY
jgi:hypothetical protein